MVKHFFVLQAYEEGMAKIIFNISGAMVLQGDELQTGADVCAGVVHYKDFDELLPYVERAFTIEDGQPLASHGKRQFPLGLVVRSVFCSAGGKMATGRAPPGPIVRKIKRRRGKRTKGRRQDEDIDDDDIP